MDKFIFGKKILSLVLVMFFITGCLPSDIPRSNLSAIKKLLMVVQGLVKVPLFRLKLKFVI
jgi:hypothetical protein